MWKVLSDPPMWLCAAPEPNAPGSWRVIKRYPDGLHEVMARWFASRDDADVAARRIAIETARAIGAPGVMRVEEVERERVLR